MAGGDKQSSLSETVLRVAREHRPRTVRELAKIVRNGKEELPEIQVLASVRELAESDRMDLLPPRFSSFATYLVNFRWNIMLWTVVALLSVYVVLHFLFTGFPWTLLQIPPALALVFFFPGRNLLRILLGNPSLSGMERHILSLATSIVLVLLGGLAMNFSGIGLQSGSAVGLVVALNLFLAMAASFLEYTNSHIR